MQIPSLTIVVALSLVVASFAEKNLARNFENKFPDFSQLSTAPAVKLTVSPDANTDTTNWVMNTFYLGSGCSGSVITTQYQSTGFCYPTSDPNVYHTHTCTSGKIEFIHHYCRN